MRDVSSLSEWVSPEKSALLVVDMQNDFCHPEGALARKGLDVSHAQQIIPTLKEVMAGARNAGIPVVVISVARDQSTAWPALERVFTLASGSDYPRVCVKGTWGAELLEGFEPKPGDIPLEKTRYSAFMGTNLDFILKNLNVENLIMTGCATNVCVDSTLRDGFMRGYNIVLLDDACAASTPSLHEVTLETVSIWFGRVEQSEDVLRAWSEVGERAPLEGAAR